MSRTKYEIELMLKLDRGRKGSFRQQLAAELRNAIKDGRLAAGARLPSTRTLADDLEVSRGVVTDAFAQLAAEGLIEQRPGAGTHVTGMLPAERVILTDQPHNSPRFNLVGTLPDLTLFPRKAWTKALRQAINEMPSADLGYCDPRGRKDLRDQLAGYLSRVRGVAARREHLLVTNGYTQGLSLTLRALQQAGARRVAVENPSDPDQWDTIKRSGLEVVPVPVTAEGMDISALEKANVDAALLTPAHQFPTGVSLSPDHRRRIVGWASRNKTMIIEDDYDSAYRYDRSPVGTLQQLAPDRVVHIGSVSKLLAPVLRMGWVVAPAQLLEPIAKDRWSLDAGQNGIDQAAFALFLADGELDRHLRRSRKEYGARWLALQEALERLLPEARIEGIPAGLHLMLRLPPAADGVAISQVLASQNIEVHPVEHYLLVPEAGRNSALIIGYGRLQLANVEMVASRIATAARQNMPKSEAGQAR